MKYGIECWLDEKRLFTMEADAVGPEMARSMAIELLQTHLQKKVLGDRHEMNRRVVRIVIAPQPAEIH